MATPDWMLKFPSVRLHHLPGFSSNHKLIWLCSDDVQSRFFRPQRPFRFEATWLKYERCEEVVNEAWDMDSIGYPMGKVLLKVNNCQNLLSTWNGKLFGNVCSMLIKKRKELEQVEWLPISGGNQNRLKLLNEEIQKLVEMEECLWQQRAKEDWLRDGDQNTKYFHCKSTERNKRYFISGLENEHGESIEEENQIGALLTAYYTKLFMSSNPTNFDRVLEGVDQKVSATINAELLRPFEPSEVQEALKQMESGTAPGSDGLPPLFYKKFWNKVWQEVTEVVLAALNTGITPMILATLILKIQSPRKVIDSDPLVSQMFCTN